MQASKAVIISHNKFSYEKQKDLPQGYPFNVFPPLIYSINYYLEDIPCKYLQFRKIEGVLFYEAKYVELGLVFNTHLQTKSYFSLSVVCLKVVHYMQVRAKPGTSLQTAL